MNDPSRLYLALGRKSPALAIVMGLSLLQASPAAAQLVSGTYVGDGTDNRRFTGLGFRPDLVLVKETVSEDAVIHTSTMAGDASKPMILDVALTADQIQSLDADGFTVGSGVNVNKSSSTYYWTAFKLQPGMKLGTYTGNGSTQSITGLAFSPDYVIVMSAGAARAIHAHSQAPAGRSYEFDSAGWLAGQITSLDADGFSVNHDGAAPWANASGVVYHYVAWDASAGSVAVGRYQGNATDNRSITGIGFRPEFLIAKAIYNNNDLPDLTPPPMHRSAVMPYDAAWNFSSGLGTNHIQQFEADGFQLGSAASTNRAYADCNLDGPGCEYFYVAFNQVALDPPPLATADGGATITVTAPTSFELSFTSAANGGIQTFYDLAEDSGRTTDLVGGNPGKKAMFYDAIGQGAIIPTWYTTYDSTGAAMHLLEATATRVRVRSEGFYGSSILAGLKAYGDYAVYPSGRLALKWERRATSAVSHHQQDLNLCLHRSTGTLSNWVPYSQTDGSFLNPGTDDFVLARIDMDLARTDFLQVVDRDWIVANSHQASATSAAYNDPGILYTDEYAVVQWQDDNLSTIPAGTSEVWSFLTYFKPTNLGDHTDPAVTSRSADYRSPALPAPSPGSIWQDAAESSGPADAYNESEAAYVFDLDPVSGLTFTLDATAGAPRYQPFFKIRQWRSFVDTPTVTAGGPPLAKRTDYLADLKPVARAHFAQDLLWHSTLENTTTAVTAPDVGAGGTVTGGSAVAARYGNGFQVTAATDYVSIPIASFNLSRGAVEFWFRPAYASNDGVQHHIGGAYASAMNSFVVAKSSANTLLFSFVAGGSASTCTATAGSFSWRANDWVHLRVEWDDTAALATQQRILVNGVEPAHTDPAVDYSSGSLNLGGNPFTVGVVPALGAASAGVYDEVHVYGGSSSTPGTLAYGGLTAAAGEFLADATAGKNFTLALSGVDALRAGEYLYLGADSRFRGLNVALAQAGSGVAADAIEWEYWNGMAWVTLEGAAFTDETQSLTRDRGTVYWTADPAGWSVCSVNGGPDLFYVRAHLAPGASYAIAPQESVIKTDILLFQYAGQLTANTTFAFGVPAPTAVELMSFEATAADGAVDLTWQTGSELDNLGFHLHRGRTEAGPWTRLTPSLIPGLGSSPIGQAYSWHDGGLTNGVRYFYRLEDVDAASVSTFHGPVSAVPVSAPPAPGEGGEGEGGGDGAEGGDPGLSSCPSWVLAAAPDAVSPRCTRHGDPEAVSLDVVSRDAESATLELRTGGFWALHEGAGGGEVLPNGADAAETVRVFDWGLEFPSDPRAAALPLRRALVEAVVGKGVELVSAEGSELRVFGGLRPSAVGIAEMEVGEDGTVRPGRRGLAPPAVSRGYVPRKLARLAGTVFQGERKSAVVEITPVRVAGGDLVLAGRVRVRLAFTGVEEGESGAGSRGRAAPRRGGGGVPEVLAQLHITRRGLHTVTFEQLFPERVRGFSRALMRLQRQGEAVAFHVEPQGPVFGPGSVLYFFADGTASSTDYSAEVAYELVRAAGVQMPTTWAAPAGGAVATASTGSASFETNRIYQPGLLEAPDIWLWQAALSGAAPPAAVSFPLSGVAGVQPARLVVQLQGGSASGQAVDHHVRFTVNGTDVGETSFAGKRAKRVELSVAASLLRDGTNELSLVNVADTGVTSLAFLDRFEVDYPQLSRLRGGVFEGVWVEGGAVEVGGLSAVSGVPVILRDPGLPGPEGSAVRWVSGFRVTPGSVRFQAEAGHRYLVVSPEGLLSPRIGRISLSTLREATNQADYLVIAPREFVEAAQPLLERRRGQGLSSRAVSLEEIASQFGHGQPSAEAIRGFLSYAYHSWQAPSPRYVLLLGDSTVDPQRFVATSGPSPLPALWAKTSYLWTVSDPALAAVNGEDLVPDLAIGRLSATTVEEAERLVSKVLAWEETAEGLAGAAVLVADNPDRGGDFEADVEDIRTSFLSGQATTVLRVGELGGGTRGAILEAFDEGVSLMSYVGHGGTAVWASENVLNNWDVPALRAQSRQPLLLTLNCLNGYFVTPNLDALPEALLKAEGRGVVAAFSPSGLSLDGPAHQYHRAVMAEITSGEHDRLGDAILAAQRSYAEIGLMPELLEVYELLGDPAMKVR